MEKLLIVDGNSIFNRAFYGVRMLNNSAGLPTNAIFGFLNILCKHLEEQKPDYLCVAFDLRAPTFRHKRYDGYKAQRKGMPEELAVQMPHLREVLDAMQICQLTLEGYEADDIIGTVSRICQERGIACGIVTGDKDDLQLASETTRILLTTTRMGQTTAEELDAEDVREKMGVTPAEYIDVKGLMGDPSDNIPGVSGIGEKTAFALIGEFHSIDGVYEHLDSPSIKKGVREKLLAGRDMANLSRELATICLETPIDFSPEDARIRPYDRDALYRKLSELEMQKLIDRFALRAPKDEIVEAAEEVVCLEADADAIACAAAAEIFPFLYEDDAVQFAADGKCYRAPIEAMRAVLENPRIEKLTHEYKRTKHRLAEAGITLAGAFYDTQIAAYLCDPQRADYPFDALCREAGLAPCAASLEQLRTAQLREIEAREQTELLLEMELPLETVLYEMERLGVCVDRAELERFGAMLATEIGGLEQQIYFMAGGEFNINSTKQLGKVLFEDLNLPAVKKTKTGYSTDSDVLDKLRGSHEIIELLMQYRQLAKLKSTYTDGMLPLIAADGRIHSTLNQTVTATGRISSTEPNLQNIPVRTELGRELRKMFVAGEGKVLVGADYSQIELRVLAHLAEDETMRRAFAEHVDIHSTTASQIFGVPDFLVDSSMRARAKTVNFGIVYGQSSFSLAKELHISRKEAQQYIDSYFATYSGVRRYMDATIAEAHANGYVTTMFHRRRYVPELKSRNFNLRSFGERVAMNTPIQGTAADIIKLAMIRVYRALEKECPNSHLILQVHDELIVEADVQEAARVAEILKREMEGAAALSVPLEADVKTGKSWYETK